MSDRDDRRSDAARRSSRYPKRERVTLKWESAPLALPGEDESPPDDPTPSSELALPSLDGDEVERSPSIPPPGEHPVGADGWERQMPPMRSAPPPRPPSVVPSAASAPPGTAPLEGGALSLVDERSRPSRPSIDMAAEMRDRHALGDYTAALSTAELILGRHPDHAEARTISADCRERLAQLHTSRLGSTSRVPRVAIDATDVRWLGLDHRAGFLLSRVDGEHSVEQLVDVSGMPRLEALKTLVELLELGAIRFS